MFVWCFVVFFVFFFFVWCFFALKKNECLECPRPAASPWVATSSQELLEPKRCPWRPTAWTRRRWPMRSSVSLLRRPNTGDQWPWDGDTLVTCSFFRHFRGDFDRLGIGGQMRRSMAGALFWIVPWARCWRWVFQSRKKPKAARRCLQNRSSTSRMHLNGWEAQLSLFQMDRPPGLDFGHDAWRHSEVVVLNAWWRRPEGPRAHCHKSQGSDGSPLDS